jgi:hypothetical protein
MIRQALANRQPTIHVKGAGSQTDDNALGNLLGLLASLDNADSVAKAVSDYLGCSVAFVVTPQDDADGPREIVQRNGSDVWVTVPLIFDNSRIGWLRATPAEASDFVLQILVLAARVTSCLVWEQSRTQRAWLKLLEGAPAPAGELQEAAQALGWQPGATLAVLAGKLTDGSGQPPPQGAAEAGGRWHRISLLTDRQWPWRVICFRRGQEFTVITPVAPAYASPDAKALTKLVTTVRTALVAREGGECAIGIGGTTTDTSRLPDLVRAANRALGWGIVLNGPSATTRPESFGILGLLVDHVPEAVLQETCRLVLGPLLEHDAQKGTSFCQTLQVFLASDGHYREAARLLYVHENTLRHRIKRIQNTLSIDLDDAYVRAAVFTYLKLNALGIAGPQGWRSSCADHS